MIATKDVTDLPIVGPNFLNLLSLTPGVTGAPAGLGSSSSQSGNDVFNADPNVSLNASGNRSEQNGFAVDSGTTTSTVRHGVVNLQPNAESIQEVRITVNNFSAEQGNDAGASVNALTKQGSNGFHGSLAVLAFERCLAGTERLSADRAEVPAQRGSRQSGRADCQESHVLLRIVRCAEGGRNTGIDGHRRDACVRQPDCAALSDQQVDIPDAELPDFRRPGPEFPDRRHAARCRLRRAVVAFLVAIGTPIGDVPCNMAVTGDGVNPFNTPRAGQQWNGRVDHMLTNTDRLMETSIATC